MERRKFLNLLTIGIPAAIITPIVLIPKEENKVWINIDEWKFHKQFESDRKIVLRFGEEGYKNYQQALMDYYKDMSATEFLNHISHGR